MTPSQLPLMIVVVSFLCGLTRGSLVGDAAGTSAALGTPEKQQQQAPPTRAATAVQAPSAANSLPPDEPVDPEGQGNWEADFAWGLYYSKLAADAADSAVGPWRRDTRSPERAAIPARMLHAERLLHEGAARASPSKKQQEKRAEEALRLYHHAKWLAERNYASAAIWRFREASRIAKESKRSVLAAHALSRLGYFLLHWRRNVEAREVLEASEKINTKANPLGPFLFGVLERQNAGAELNVEKLLAAEERILKSGKQPSEDLELQRRDLVQEISYWRLAEASPMNCFQGFNSAHVMICLCGHAASAVQQTMQRVMG